MLIISCSEPSIHTCFSPSSSSSSSSSSAAICRNPGEALVIEEIEVAPPKTWRFGSKSPVHRSATPTLPSGSPFAVFPRIFGHEAVG
ncbi:unnamed protein product, partial [Thlaspi arvense]